MSSLDQLIGQAQALAGFPRCTRGEHTWVAIGGRRCPRCPEDHDIDCSQVVYECAACDEQDYGYPGGPAHRECFEQCPNEYRYTHLLLQANAPAGPPSHKDQP